MFQKDPVRISSEWGGGDGTRRGLISNCFMIIQVPGLPILSALPRCGIAQTFGRGRGDVGGSSKHCLRIEIAEAVCLQPKIV